jgi:gentisate 1,2-dioxygenase
LNAPYSARTSAADFTRVDTLEGLYELLNNSGMGAGWHKPTPSLYPLPKREFAPARWSYAIAKPALDAAGRLVSTEFAERRNLILANPIPGNTYATARTMVAAYQMVKAGETARSHRHTPNALRLAIDSHEQMYTVVQGKKIPMKPGDILLTPNWLWHGHNNESDRDAYWIDFLDAPLVQFLDPMFFEHYPAIDQERAAYDADSAMRYPYAVTGMAVRASAPIRQGERRLELGAKQLDTIGLYLRHFDADAVLMDRRCTANRIYAVIEGSGDIAIADRTFDWTRGDVLVAPAWNEVRWVVREEAVVLLVTDAPVLAKLNWLYTDGDIRE